MTRVLNWVNSMADISRPVVFDAKLKKLILSKQNDPKFTYDNWGDADLLPLRKFVRKHYRPMQNKRCYFCKNPLSKKSALNCQVEHLIPKSVHPQFIFTPKNLCLICCDCNESKGTHSVTKASAKLLGYPRSSKQFTIVHPHFDEYSKYIHKTEKGHFTGLDDNGARKGSYTIFVCGLNKDIDEIGGPKIDHSEMDEFLEMARRISNNKSDEEIGNIIAKVSRALTN